MEKQTPVIFTLVIDRAEGSISVANNVSDENVELPLLYKALRVLEAQIFDAISAKLLVPAEGKALEDDSLQAL